MDAGSERDNNQAISDTASVDKEIRYLWDMHYTEQMVPVIQRLDQSDLIWIRNM